MSNQDEIERLQRLRDRQLRARDPLAYNNQLQRRISVQHKKARSQRLTFRDIIDAIPFKWRGLIIGALAGLVVWIVVTLLATVWIELSRWADIIGVVAIFVLAVTGLIIGHGFDTREELKKLIE